MTLKKEYTFRDPVIKTVVDKFVERSDVGFEKYGVTLDEDNAPLVAWMNHLQEELMDAVNYIEKLKHVTTELLQERMLEEYKYANETKE
ncbi:MAG: hypothetical protein DWQ49_06995 [Bacteroidetes bacterium]|nr:MAG: hypothetical protein DWQ49_06995 [Bacteroidota bacterium]